MSHTGRYENRGLRRGFALVLTLALLSFLLLLVATLATSLRIETQTSFNNTQWNHARQNALLGMNIALGQLQELAGPDQRVTARGDILTSQYSLPDGHRYWTGVWDSLNGSFKGWLVSDFIESETEDAISRATPQPSGDGTSAWMVNQAVDTGSTGDEIRRVAIRKQPIRVTGIPGLLGEKRVTTGNYAYWISDEAVKASVLKTDLPIPGYDSISGSNKIRQLANRLTDLKKVVGTASTSDTPGVDQLFTFEQLRNIKGVGEKSISQNFHQITPVSLGVLANTLGGTTGGLRNDLSQYETTPNGTMPVNEDLFEFLEFHHRDYVEVKGATAGGSEPVFFIPLVVPEFSLRVGFSRDSSDSAIHIDFNVQADLWNPFTLPIHTIPEGTTEEPELVFELSGLPSFNVTYTTNDGIERAAYTLSHKEPDEDPDASLLLSIEPLNQYRAGEISNITRRIRLVSSETFVDATPDDPDDDLFTISADDVSLRIALTLKDGSVLQEFNNVPYSGIEPAEPILIPILDNGDTLASNEMPLRFWFRFLDEDSSLENWTTELDPLGPRFDFDKHQSVGFLIEVDGEIYSGGDAGEFDNSEFFSDSEASSDINEMYRFFDLPTLEPISVASLRHLVFNDEKPNYLGNPEAIEQNLIFDEWFFSTLPDQASTAQSLMDGTTTLHKRPFLNPHIWVRGDTRSNELFGSTEIAKEAMLFGAFNINCTDSKVWEIILSGNDIDSWNDSDLENPFFRFPHTADRFHKNPTFRRSWYKTHGTGGGAPVWSAAYTVGVRELTDDQIESLAEEIVRQITLWNTPSLSISDFLNRGILANAIDKTSINTTTGTTYENASGAIRIPRNAPAFLNQADILNHIAPFIQARSDTFRIRAYGDAVNPVTGKVEGRAWCEAWVQRVPGLVDPGGDIAQSATGLGRKFKITHFKWLDESQI